MESESGRVLSVREAVVGSWLLLSQRDRRLLGLVTIAQMATSFLDLMGVLLIGAVAALSLSVVSNTNPPALIERVLEVLGLSSLSSVAAAGALAGAAAAVLMVKTILSILLTRRTLRFLAFRQAFVSGRLAAGLLSRPILQVQQRSSQETAFALTTGVNYATLVVLGQAVVVASEVALMSVLLIGLFLVDAVVTIFTLAYFAVLALILHRLVSSWAGRLGAEGARSEIESLTLMQQALRAYRELVVSDRRELYVEKFQGLRWRAASIMSDVQFVALVPKYVFEVGLVIGGILLAGSQLLTNSAYAAVSTIAIFLAAGSRIVPSIMRLQGALLGIRGAAGGAGPTLALASELDIPAGSVSSGGNESLSAVTVRQRIDRGYPDFVPSIHVRDASVTFPGATSPAIRHVSVDVPTGSSLALVGSTGAGKSTLTDVILGILQPDSGDIAISGMTPRDAISTWPGAIAYVPQDVSLFAGTVRENVTLGLPSEAVSDERVWEALTRAHLAGFLRDTREGLETVVGESGIRLSGGQRQRLGVARALYTRPRLLVLDEATSALDAETEAAVTTMLRELEGHVTTVTVAHRLATIRHCDSVMLLESGRVVALGSFEEVRAKSSDFDRQAKLLGL